MHIYFIKEKLDSRLITTPFVFLGNQLVDVLTKSLPTARSQTITNKLEMEDIYLSA